MNLEDILALFQQQQAPQGQQPAQEQQGQNQPLQSPSMLQGLLQMIMSGQQPPDPMSNPVADNLAKTKNLKASAPTLEQAKMNYLLQKKMKK